MKLPSYEDYLEYCELKKVKPLHTLLRTEERIIKPYVMMIITWAFNRGARSHLTNKRKDDI